MPDSYAEAETLVKQWAEEYLAFQGETGFDVWVSSVKFIVELSDGSKQWWLYNARQIEQKDVVGVIAIWMMNRTSD